MVSYYQSYYTQIIAISQGIWNINSKCMGKPVFIVYNGQHYLYLNSSLITGQAACADLSWEPTQKFYRQAKDEKLIMGDAHLVTRLLH